MRSATKANALVLAVVACLSCRAALASDAADCKAIREFVASVQPGEERNLTFRTMWGGSFKDDKDPSDKVILASKRCEHHEYGPAKAACAYLLENGSTEFAGGNLGLVMHCLARVDGLDNVWFETAELSLTYGDENRGANVDVVLAEDAEVGGMALKMTVSGY
jgi:hypothetical protein